LNKLDNKTGVLRLTELQAGSGLLAQKKFLYKTIKFLAFDKNNS